MGQTTTSVKFEKFAEQWFKEYAKLNLQNTTCKRKKQITYVFQRAQLKASEAITSMLDFSSKNNRAS